MSERRGTLYISETPFGPVLPGGPDDGDLCLEVRGGVAGAWTELRGGREIIVFGYPEQPRSPWFQVLRIPAKGHHALSLAIERIVYARSIARIVSSTTALARVAEHSVAVYHGLIPVTVASGGKDGAIA